MLDVETHRYIFLTFISSDLKIICVASIRSMDDPPGIPAFGSHENILHENLNYIIQVCRFSPGKVANLCRNYTYSK